jgi:hypothetical protein
MPEASPDFISSELQKFSITDAAIAQLQKRLFPIKVADENDRANYELARKGRLEVKALRVSVEKTRKALKEDSLRFGKAVDAHARKISLPLEQIESHLQQQEDIVAKYKERVEAEQRAKLEAERVAREEEIRLKEQRLEAERAAIQKEREEIEAERERMEQAKRHQAEIEAAKVEAARVATLEAEERARQQAAKEVAAELQMRQQAQQLAELRPDQEKLKDFAAQIEAIARPNVTSEIAINAVRRANDLLCQAAQLLNAFGNKVTAE